MISEFFANVWEDIFPPGCLGDARYAAVQTAEALGTNSIGGDPVVGIYVAGVAGGLGFLHSNFQWYALHKALRPIIA